MIVPGDLVNCRATANELRRMSQGNGWSNQHMSPEAAAIVDALMHGLDKRRHKAGIVIALTPGNSTDPAGAFILVERGVYKVPKKRIILYKGGGDTTQRERDCRAAFTGE